MPAEFEVKLPTTAANDYQSLKQLLISEAKASGDDPPKLQFDDTQQTIGIEYGFKQFMDRFPKGAPAVKKAVGLEQDKRPYQDIFRNELATAQTQQRYADKESQVLRDLRGLGDQKYTEPAQPLAIGAAAATPKDAAAAAMKTQPGLCLDDNHAEGETKDMLIAGMDDLAKEGVTTLFIEHFWQEQQTLLDDYLNGPDGAALPPALAEAVRKLDAAKGLGGQQHFERLLAAAKKSKVRVVGLDSFDAKTPQDNDPRNWERRAARFNQTAAEVVQREKGAGKFVLMAGAKHNNTHEGGIPGLGQLLGVHTVKLNQGKLEPHAEDKSLRGMRSEAEQAYIDAFVDRFKAQRPLLLAAKPPGGDTEKAQAGMRAEGILHAATVAAKALGANLERLTPAKIAQVAQQAADRGIVEIDANRVNLSSKDDGPALAAAADARDKAYTDKLKVMSDAARAGPASYAKFAAEFAGADPRLLMEPFVFKQGSIEVEGASALHIAAMCGDAAAINALTAAGMRVDSRDAQGNTPLHASGLANAATDDATVVRNLVAAGASLTQTNRKGQTPVHLAAFGGKNACLGELALHADFARANVADRRGWTPADMATAAGKTSTEDWLFAQGHAQAPNLLSTAEEATGMSTIEILVRATKVEGPVDQDGNPTETAAATEAKVRAHFTELYRQPELRQVLDLAAADALGKRSDARKALRVYMTFNSDFAGSLTGKGGKGAFDDRSNTLVLAAKCADKELRGTAVHEMTHHAADMVFGNQAVPYDQEASVEAVAYRAAIEADFRVAQGFLAGPEKEIAYTMGGRMNEYRRANLGEKRKPLLQEYVVGVPQVIAEHGLEYAQKVAPNLTAFFSNQFAAKCGTALTGHAKFAAVAENTATVAGLQPIPKVDTSSKTWVSLGVSSADTGPVKLGEGTGQPTDLYIGVAIKNAHLAATGVVPPTYPATTEYASVANLPQVLDWSWTDTMTIPEAKELSDSNILNKLQRRFRVIARDLPPEVSAETLEQFVDAAAADLPGFTAAQLDAVLDKIANKARDTVRISKLAYLPRAQATGKLTPDLVARTVIYEAACQALDSDAARANRVPGEGPLLDDEKVDRLVAEMVKKMSTDQMNKLAADPAKVKQFATALTGSETSGKIIKTTVLHGFYTKKLKSVDSASQVDVKVDRAKKEWVKKLATL